MTSFSVVYDACVLYPAPLRDLLMHLSLTDLYRAKWTAEIHEEWIRNVLTVRQDLTCEQLERTRKLMDTSARDCLVTGYEFLIPTLTLPDQNDRHVLAAAIRSQSSVILTFNRLLTEEIVECYRDIDELLVIGGVIWGDNPSDDHFLKSHGVRTPDAFWKVIFRGIGQDERAIAWIVPNSPEATKKNLDKYLVSVEELERATGEKIPVADYAKYNKPAASWLIPRGCNKG